MIGSLWTSLSCAGSAMIVFIYNRHCADRGVEERLPADQGPVSENHPGRAFHFSGKTTFDPSELSSNTTFPNQELLLQKQMVVFVPNMVQCLPTDGMASQNNNLVIRPGNSRKYQCSLLVLDLIFNLMPERTLTFGWIMWELNPSPL